MRGASGLLCTLQLCLFLAAVPQLASSLDVTLAGIFREGWAHTHLAAASIAVHHINNDDSILKGVKMRLEHFDIEPVVQAKSSDDPLKKCFVNSVLTDERFENVSAIVGIGYSSDTKTFMPFLNKMDLLHVTHCAASSEFSDKDKFPNFARVCRSGAHESIALVDIVHTIIQHTSAKLLNCGDPYCSDCAAQVRTRAAEVGVRIVDDYDYGDFAFTDMRDVQLSNRLNDIVNNCSEASVVIICGHDVEARNIMQTAHSSQLLWQKQNTHWVMSAWPANGVIPETPGVLTAFVTMPAVREGRVSAVLAYIRRHWASMNRDQTGNDMEATLQSFEDGDVYVRYAYDTVWMVAKALDWMHLRGISLRNNTALKLAIQQVSFLGISSLEPVKLDANLDNEARDFEVRNWVRVPHVDGIVAGEWKSIAYLDKGVLTYQTNRSINDITYATGDTGKQPPQECSAPKETLAQYFRRPEVIGLLVSASFLCILISVVVYVWWKRKPIALDHNEVALRTNVSTVRAKLGLTRRDGVLMSNEKLTFLERCWGGKADTGVIDKSHLEALARLHLMQNFDASHVDALVVFVHGISEGISDSFPSRSSSFHSSFHITAAMNGDLVPPPFTAKERESLFDLGRRKEKVVRRKGSLRWSSTMLSPLESTDTTAFEALCRFLLDACERLISSNFEHDLKDANVTIHELKAAGIQVEVLIGQKSDDRGGQTEKPHAEMPSLPSRSGDAPVVMSQISVTELAGAVQPSPDQAQTFSSTSFLHTLLPPQRSTIAHTLSNSLHAQSTSNAATVLDSRFRFLKDKIMQLRIWHTNEQQLFQKLKKMVQRKMDVYASICEYKFVQKFASDPNGVRLMALQPISLHSSITRQDHDSVRAVRVDEESRREVAALFEIRKAEQAEEGIDEGVRLDAKGLHEEVFVTQLAVRAQAINAAFQQHVESILETRSVETTHLSGTKREFKCRFESGVAKLSLYRAPFKSRERMREKVLEYMADEFPSWPLSGYILVSSSSSTY